MSIQTEQLNELHWLMEMLHTIDVGLVVLDRDYSIQIWNGFMENHSGLLPREVKGKILFDLFLLFFSYDNSAIYIDVCEV